MPGSPGNEQEPPSEKETHQLNLHSQLYHIAGDHQVYPCCGSHLVAALDPQALTLHLWDKAHDPAVSLPSTRCTISADRGCSSVGSSRALLFVPTCVSLALASADLGKGLGLGLVISSRGDWKVITKLREKALLT